MRAMKGSAELAIGWIEAWIRMDMAWLRQYLSLGFIHTSPFGRLEGREFYLATVEPMARKSVMALVIKDVLANDKQAAIWFENRTPNGIVDSCDWLWIEQEQIKAVRSFYDSNKIRSVLTPSEQKDLGAY